ncbi:MAG: GIY-YIG nuclease family protein, partial [Planctomycetota bacterium]
MWSTTEITARTRLFEGFGENPFAPPEADRPEPVRVDGKRKPTLKNGVRRLAEQRPGVYGMLDRDGRLVYVGKSKRLRSRLLSYFTARRGEKGSRIVGSAGAIVWEPLPSEFAALLRELQLIREFRPRWNVTDRPRNAPPAFLCLGRHPAPTLFATRRPPADAAVFGPFGSLGYLTKAAEVLNDLFGLRDCPQHTRFVFKEDRALFDEPPRPGCLRFEVGGCVGPCCGGCSRRQ